MGLLSKVTKSLFGDPTKGYDQAIGATNRASELARGDLAPYREFGQNYLANLRDMPAFRAPSMADVESTPGYQFRFGEGRRALENSAVARGGLLSGNTGRDLTEYGQNFATGEYNNAYNRASNEYQNELARLMGFVNLGYGAAGGSANIAQNTGNSLAQLYANRGLAESDVMQFPWKLGATLAGTYYGAKAAGGGK